MRWPDKHPRRFWAKVAVADGCWRWRGGLDRDGYGLYWLDGRCRYAHVVAYGLLRGPVPAGLQLDHTCRVHACVNPAHLEPVTRRVNILRGVSPPAANAAKVRCAHGHELTPENTYRHARGWRVCRTCALAGARRYQQRRTASSMGLKVECGGKLEMEFGDVNQEVGAPPGPHGIQESRAAVGAAARHRGAADRPQPAGRGHQRGSAPAGDAEAASG